MLYLNLESDQLADMAKQQVQDGVPVWFGCDVGKMLERKLGIMDTGLYDYDTILNTDLSMTQGRYAGLRAHLPDARHDADGCGRGKRPDQEMESRKQLGDEIGEKGFFVMSQEWFKVYTHQVVVNQKYLTAEQRKALETEPVELKPWDPIGSLAECE